MYEFQLLLLPYPFTGYVPNSVIRKVIGGWLAEYADVCECFVNMIKQTNMLERRQLDHYLPPQLSFYLDPFTT